MQQIAILSGKGGTGKTSISATFACLNKTSVIVDCDVDAANMHLVLSPHIKEKGNFNCGNFAVINSTKCIKCGRCRQLCRFEAVKKDFTIDKILCEGCGVCVWNCPNNAIKLKTDMSGEWFISDSKPGVLVHANLGIGRENSGKLVSYIRVKAKEIAKQNNVDTVIIDGPPGIGCPVIASVTGVNKVLVVTEPSLSALNDLKRILELIENFNIKTFVCVNKCDLNTNITQEIKNLCLKQKINFSGQIPFNTSFVKAVSIGKTVVEGFDDDLKIKLENIWHNIKKG